MQRLRKTHSSVGSIPSSFLGSRESALNLAIDAGVRVPNLISLSMSMNSAHRQRRSRGFSTDPCPSVGTPA